LKCRFYAACNHSKQKSVTCKLIMNFAENFQISIPCGAVSLLLRQIHSQPRVGNRDRKQPVIIL
jgi:hypothetical protein